MQADTATAAPTRAHPLAQWLFDKSNYLIRDIGGGPRPLRLEQAINLQKVTTVFFIYGLMHWYDNFSLGAWVYLALHGSYGYTWLIKDLAFPNAAFSKPITIGALCVLYGGLNLAYWGLPWLFISRHVEPSGASLCAAVALHTLGVSWMAAADLQKNCILRYRPGLITNGVFTYTRNPNYLGEIMIYVPYALLAAHWLGWLVIAAQFLLLFLPRMLVKDASIARHPGWQQYRQRSGLLLPWRILNGRALFERRSD